MRRHVAAPPLDGTRTVRRRATPRALVRLAWVALALLVGAGAAHAQKTDSVWIRNGDRITGEVKSLSKGLLKYSTDDLGTVYVEWDKVDRISSRATFEVQLRSGEKLFGTLGLARSGRLVLGADTLLLADIVRITSIKRRMLDRVTGYLDLGMTYQKAHNTLQVSSGAKATYRGPQAESIVEFSTFREERDDASETSRLTTSLTERLLFADRWAAGLAVGFERNEELDLAGRLRLMPFVGRMLMRSNHVDLVATAGLVGTRERYVTTDSASLSVEGLLAATYSAFRYDRPKLDAAITSQIYPSLSIRGRVRLQNDLRVSYELVKDFMATVTVFDSYDNKPQAAAAPKHDFGTTLAISWTF